MTLGSVQEGVVTEEQDLAQEARDGTPFDAKADGSSPAQQRDVAEGADHVELPRALSAYVVVLRERKEGDAQTALDMASRSVSPKRVGCLLDFVSQLNTSLVRLCLSKNPLGPEGARLLGNALVTNNTLQVLELDACELVGSAYRPQHEGVLALSKGLQSVRSQLRFVNVARNDLQPQGCRIVLGALSFHKTLTALDISDNMLSLFNDKQGYLALTYLLQYSKQLCWLSISDNPLPAAAATALTESLSSNHSLTTLYASRCGILREQWLASSSSQNDSAGKKKNRRSRGLFHTLKC